jgi:hypothetical protein
MLLKFEVKRAPESCQNLRQKVKSKLSETETAQKCGCAVVPAEVPEEVPVKCVAYTVSILAER